MKASGLEGDYGTPPPAATAGGILRQFHLPEQHVRLTQVMLQDQTDVHNELVQTREWLLHPAEEISLQGNLFVLENTLTGAGRVLLKLESLPHARALPLPVDLRVRPRKAGGFEVTVSGNEAGADEGPLLADLPYRGGAFGRIRVLQQFQRSLRPEAPVHRVPRFLSNTWGDRSRDSRMCEAFIAQEIEAGARLGVEVVQLDDGWQSGMSANSARANGGGAWAGFWKTDPDFWKPDPVKFPGGLAPLAQQATACGMELGLWYAPDSSESFANWQRDAACLTAFHRDYGIRFFKMDSIHAADALAQRNLQRLFEAVRRKTGDDVVFDLDVTAQLRPGYFGLPAAGPLFVENRYTDWHGYWPHQTLRNLWQLSAWVDPGRLRMEFLNNSRNAGLYPADPLAPAHYRPDALFATVFFSNPLGWFEVSNLPASYFEQLPPLVRLWKDVRKELFAGTIVPIGNAPDGVAWTGFASVAEDRSSALVLVFRELNPAGATRLAIPGCEHLGRARCRVLAGDGAGHWDNGRLSVRIGQTLGWALIALNAE